MHSFEAKALKFIEANNMFCAGDTVILGVSGGADSTALLVLLNNLSERLNISLKVVHVNHGLRDEAYSEAKYVEKLCNERKIEFVLYEYDVHTMAKERGLGHEEMGRILRYEAFNEALGDRKGKIAVAHNMNDLCETMLFNLFRGTGIKGLSSIQPVRGNVVRPLLQFRRKEIEEYLESQDIAYCIDKSNLEDEYTRNRIRNNIIPAIEKNVADKAVIHMAETASQLSEIEVYLESQISKSFEACLIRKDKDSIVYKKEEFDGLDNLIKKGLTKRAIDELVPKNKDITHVHLESLISLEGGAGYKEIKLPYGLIAFVSYNETGIRFGKTEKETGFDYELPITGKITVPGIGTVKSNKFVKPEGYIPSQNQYTKSLDYDKINEIVRIRSRLEGDYLTVNKSLQTKKLKDYLINEKVPSANRDKVPIIACGSDVIWVVGYRISEKYKVTDDTKTVLEITFVKEEI